MSNIKINFKDISESQRDKVLKENLRMIDNKIAQIEDRIYGGYQEVDPDLVLLQNKRVELINDYHDSGIPILLQLFDVLTGGYFKHHYSDWSKSSYLSEDFGDFIMSNKMAFSAIMDKAKIRLITCERKMLDLCSEDTITQRYFKCKTGFVSLTRAILSTMTNLKLANKNFINTLSENFEAASFSGGIIVRSNTSSKREFSMWVCDNTKIGICYVSFEFTNQVDGGWIYDENVTTMKYVVRFKKITSAHELIIFSQ